MKHSLNQTGNDWITCTCGKLFFDSKNIDAKEKFLNHLQDHKINSRIILSYNIGIQRTKHLKKRSN